MKLTLARIAEFVSASGEFSREEVAQGYSIDSRTVGPGQLFFAVKGERLDGHDFVEQALQKINSLDFLVQPCLHMPIL